jgi:hypothetical protein
LARDRGTDVCFTLMVRNEEIDRFAKHLPASILDRHSRGDDRTRTTEIRVHVGLVIEDADSYDVVGNLGCRCSGADDSCREQAQKTEDY